jgi:succinate dehydrogenase / fumarate reductase, cytochrome b subunit
MYRGQTGMWLWVLHRLTGVGILAFLFLHIADTYLVGLGPQYYNELVFLYHLPPFRAMEILLVGAVLFHAVNGLRVILLDFLPSAINYQRQLLWISIVVFFLLFIPAGGLMAIKTNWTDWTI